MPEYRGSSGSPIVLILVLLVVLIVGGVVIFLLLGSNSASQDTIPPTPVPQPVVPINPAAAPAAPLPTLPPLEPAQTDDGPAAPQPFQPPQVLFGEVLAQGFVDLQLQAGQVRTFFTFQVDTSTQNIILFFALYDPTGQSISRSIVVENYSQSELIDNAELTVYYPDAPATVIRLNRAEETVESSQFYTTQPHGPGLFSSQMRIALIKQNLPLASDDGSIGADVQLDPTGVADLSGYRVTVKDPATTETGLAEIQEIIDQLESRRPRS
jgi:hypothetical protein